MTADKKAYDETCKKYNSPERKINWKSVKKLLGTIGAFVFYAICIIAVKKDAAQVGTVGPLLVIFVCALFAIKTAGGIAIANIVKRKDEKA